MIKAQINLNENEHIKQSLFCEVAGSSRSIISLNYERIFYIPKVENLYLSIRTGLGYTPGIKSKNLKGTTSVPATVSFLYGRKHFVVLGIDYTSTFGQDFVDTTYTPAKLYLKYESSIILNLAYRYMQYKGVMFEITPVSLIWTNNPSSKFIWGFGFGVGYAF